MRTTTAALPVVLALALTACVGGRSPGARFYQLQASSTLAPAAAPLDPSVFVVVKPVALESYLRQPQIARRVSPHEVQYGEFTRWAEPLDRTITRVVTENLRRALQTDRVAIVPQTVAGKQVVTLLVEVKRFELQPDGKVLLSAGWLVHNELDAKTMRIGSADLTAYVPGDRAEDAVAIQSTLLADLAAKIADDILSAAPSASTP